MSMILTELINDNQQPHGKAVGKYVLVDRVNKNIFLKKTLNLIKLNFFLECKVNKKERKMVQYLCFVCMDGPLKWSFSYKIVGNLHNHGF